MQYRRMYTARIHCYTLYDALDESFTPLLAIILVCQIAFCPFTWNCYCCGDIHGVVNNEEMRVLPYVCTEYLLRL